MKFANPIPSRLQETIIKIKLLTQTTYNNNQIKDDAILAPISVSDNDTIFSIHQLAPDDQETGMSITSSK